MFNTISCIVTNAFRIYLIDKMAATLFENKKAGTISRRVILLIFFTLNTFLYLRYHMMWINIMSNVIGISAVVSLYTHRIKNIIFGMGIIYIINVGCDVMGTALFIQYTDGRMHSQIYAIISVFLTFICEIIMEKIINRERKRIIVCPSPIILVPTCSICIISILVYMNLCKNIGIAIIGLGMTIINFLVLHIYNQICDAFSEKYEIESLRQQINLYAKEINLIQKNEEYIRIFQHDLRHHLGELSFLAEKNNNDEICKYLSQMVKATDKVEILKTTESPNIDSLISYLLIKAKEKLITVESKIVIPSALNSSYEINALMANLIENAIDAAVKTDEKYMEIRVKAEKGVMNIYIQNSYDKKQINYCKNEEGDMAFFTMKENITEHGIGMKSIKQIVTSHNGKIEYLVKDTRFIVNAILYMETFD